VVCAHAGTYFVLSLNGRYEPAVWGANGVKVYGWAPIGFVDRNLKWNRSLMVTFCPLYYLDKRFWHKDDEEDRETHTIGEDRPRRSINEGD